MSATATPSERVERIAVLLWQQAAAAVDRKTRVTALLQASSEMNRLFCRICTGTDPHWSDAAEDAAFLSKLAMTRTAADNDAEVCLDCAADSVAADEWSHNAPGDLYADMATALGDALVQLGTRGRVDVAWSVRAHRLLEDFRASRAPDPRAA